MKLMRLRVVSSTKAVIWFHLRISANVVGANKKSKQAKGKHTNEYNPPSVGPKSFDKLPARDLF